ncbi:MAG: class I SAM-dependent methyltransferase [Dehalococcoidia bacterium]
MPRNPDHQPYFDANLARWDESVAIHAASQGYDLEGYLRGEKTLYAVETEEVGDVTGRTLLHLQCHFGMDTLNWARLGATVTGLDFSPEAVVRATQLAEEIGITDARFIETNLYDAPHVLSEQFDIVYTGIGALNWLPDIRGWARVAAGFVKPGGFLYLYEGHPMLWSLDEDQPAPPFQLRYPYFEVAQPVEWDWDQTYTDGPKLKNTRGYEWNHGLGEIVTALIEEGLRLEFLHEHRTLAWQGLPSMVPVEGGVADGTHHQRRVAWQLPEAQRDMVPLMYSLRASRPR